MGDTKTKNCIILQRDPLSPASSREGDTFNGVYIKCTLYTTERQMPKLPWMHQALGTPFGILALSQHQSLFDGYLSRYIYISLTCNTYLRIQMWPHRSRLHRMSNHPCSCLRAGVYVGGGNSSERKWREHIHLTEDR